MLHDIAVITGAQLVSEELGLKLENIELDKLGSARRVVATKEKTIIIEGKGEKEAIDARINQIKEEMKDTDSDFDREKLQERLAKLSGGVAVIKVGAATEVEQKAKQHKIEDSLNASKAAQEEGVVPGGGVALAVAAEYLSRSETRPESRILSKTEKRGYLAGAEIVIKACQEPLKQIMKNAGSDEVFTHEILKGIKDKEKEDFEKPNIMEEIKGYNAITGEIINMFASGIIDPTKVVRSALENAASAASMFLTTEVVVSELPEEKGSGAPAMPAMPGGY
jgi:chaperonin GroEL